MNKVSQDATLTIPPVTEIETGTLYRSTEGNWKGSVYIGFVYDHRYALISLASGMTRSGFVDHGDLPSDIEPIPTGGIVTIEAGS